MKIPRAMVIFASRLVRGAGWTHSVRACAASSLAANEFKQFETRCKTKRLHMFAI